MMGYGMAKAAVHQLTKSLADPVGAGLPEGAVTAAILPVTLDTPMNRKWMPGRREREKERKRERGHIFLALTISFFSSPDKWASLISIFITHSTSILLPPTGYLPNFLLCILTTQSSFYSSYCPFFTRFLAALWCLSKSVFILNPSN